MTRSLIRYCWGRPLGPVGALWWLAVAGACTLNPQPLPPEHTPAMNNNAGGPSSPTLGAPDATSPVSGSSGASSSSGSMSTSGSSSGTGSRSGSGSGSSGGGPPDAGAAAEAGADAGGVQDAASGDSEANDSAPACDSPCVDGAPLGDGGSFGCTADPASNSLCGGGNPPHFYRCVVPYMQPAACQVLSIGNATDTYCCP